MSKITHYAVRDLYATGDFEYPEWDLVIRLDDGSLYYSEITFGSEREIKEYMNEMRQAERDLDYMCDVDAHLMPAGIKDSGKLHFVPALLPGVRL